jgi:hypothetical protein
MHDAAFILDGLTVTDEELDIFRVVGVKACERLVKSFKNFIGSRHSICSRQRVLEKKHLIYLISYAKAMKWYDPPLTIQAPSRHPHITIPKPSLTKVHNLTAQPQSESY